MQIRQPQPTSFEECELLRFSAELTNEPRCYGMDRRDFFSTFATIRDV